jgi:hypothetical protein
MPNDPTQQEDDQNLEPREYCLTCGGAVDTFSVDPLEEAGIEPGCGYYRAETGEEVIYEQCNS